ncbi:MAG: hypothetical protein E7124_10080 [Bacteroidales bacterium]|nr:hypothetical protein [Bacteroidales bacterium]
MGKVTELLKQCADDISKAAAGSWTLGHQVRAYDLLDSLLAADADGRLTDLSDGFRAASQDYVLSYMANRHVLDEVFDEASLREELARTLAPYDDALKESRFEAAAAASLHEFAKEVFEIWQTSGIFARRRALRELRKRAGFRLESHRIGNYVAKTFDLMNEAQARFARSQQALFAADVRYKIKPGIHKDIYRMCRACGSDLTITNENDKVV